MNFASRTNTAARPMAKYFAVLSIDVEGREQEVCMSDLKRETLGDIARLCEQMSYTAMEGHVETVKAQFDTLKKQMARLDIIRQYITQEG